MVGFQAIIPFGILIILCSAYAEDVRPPPPLPTHPPPTTLPPPTKRPGCKYKGKYFNPGTEISRGSDPRTGMCWWVKCDMDGNIVTGDFRCLWKNLGAHLFFKDEQQE